MNSALEGLLERLPESPTPLTQDNRRNIATYIPVPNDYEVLWADIQSFGGYPAGVVVTDKCLIVKSTKEAVKERAKDIKANNKNLEKKDRAPVPKDLYRIIPWEYFSPDEYCVDAISKDSFVLRSGDMEVARFASPEFCDALNKLSRDYKESRRVAEEILKNASFSAINALNTEAVMFNAAYGSGQTKAGHGIYAEEAGALLDVFNGESSTVVGRDNAKNGPDKIVNAAPVQCKYCRTASASVDACFQLDSAGKKVFRYLDLSGNPMKIEVPSDQYAAAVEKMKTKIEAGQVPSVDDPCAAYDIIRKGRLSYSQALNLAKAGTIESISFDAATGAVACTSAFGISAVVTFAQVFWKTKNARVAAKSALWTGLRVYGLSFTGSILASQIARTNAPNVLQPLAVGLANNLDKSVIQGFVNSFRALAGKKAIYGSAAQKSFVKFIGSNAMAEGVMFIVFAVPDTLNRITDRMSTAQYAKNMFALVASFAGSIGATAAAGAVLCGSFGERVNKNIGKAVGLGAGLVGGGLCGGVAKMVGNLFKEDDCILTGRLVNAVLTSALFEHMLSSEEQEALFDDLGASEKELLRLQRDLLGSSSQSKDILLFLEPKIEKAKSGRAKVSFRDELNMESEMADLIVRDVVLDEM